MRTIGTAAAAGGLAALAVGMTSQQAAAEAVGGGDTLNATLDPRTVKPGGMVDLTVQDCLDHEAKARSGVFDETTLGMPGPVQSARVMVDADAKPGARYEVTFTCGDQTAKADLRIAGGGATVSSTSRPRPSPTGSTAKPSAKPTAKPSARPTAQPTVQGTMRPPARSTAPSAGQPAARSKGGPTGRATARTPTRSTARPSVLPAKPAPSVPPAAPMGPARGGLGGSQTDGGTLIASGTALSGATLLAGVVLYRRHRGVPRG